MNYLNGGYVMIKHNATQTELKNAYKTKKPILYYDTNGFAYWAEIKETTTIVDDETIYSYSVVKLNQIETLVDSAGNPRFIEGDGVGEEITGLTITYNKWSLSGTHLMFVLAGTIANGTALTTNQLLTTFNIPEWILNKIYPTFSNIVEMKSIPAYSSDWATQNVTIQLRKDTASMQFKVNLITLTNDRTFRAQFDLLIDTDYSE